MNDSLEKRVIELESLISFQDNTIEQLNEVIYNQQLQIDNILEKISSIEGMVKNQSSGEKRTLEEERPPHY